MSFCARHISDICLTAYNLQNPVSKNPDGVKSEQIRLTARILQVTDICAALTTDRPHRAALTRRSHSQRSAKGCREDGWGISPRDEFESLSGALSLRLQRAIA
jgi:hypothetical protein